MPRPVKDVGYFSLFLRFCCILASDGHYTLDDAIPATMADTKHSEGLKLARLFMVLSGMSPLFILWAIKGNKIVSDGYLLSACAALVLIPNLVLWLRIRAAKEQNDLRDVVVEKAEDHRDHLLVYLFAMLLPFYPIDTNSVRDISALLAALAFIVFLFWHLNLHYMNIWFAIRGYRVYVIIPIEDKNVLSGRASLVLITTRTDILKGESIKAYRLSDTLCFEARQ